ncbi:MAG: glycosyltransferase [Acidimicrobiales bacterium]
MARVALVSYRLGGADGVSVEAAKWSAALSSIGWDVTTVAGDGVADVIVDGLAADARRPPPPDQLSAALANAEVVVVENVASLPLNPHARDALYLALEGRRALYRHHDLAWERPRLAHLAGPRDAPGWRHVTINDAARVELATRGITAMTLYNSFDCDPPRGARDLTRERLGVGEATVALMASRALARKNVAGALDFCASLGAVLWILGPAEDGFEPELESLVERCAVRVVRGLPDGATIHDAYAACDVVVISSTWEGFGNPTLESVTHRRPLALNAYPVSREIVAFGFGFFGLDDVDGVASFLADPDESLLDANLEIARRHFNLADLPARLGGLLDAARGEATVA